LSRVPNPLWMERFGAQATQSFLGMGPPTVRFQGDTATVPVRKNIVVQQKNYFEGWIRNANGLYEQAVKQQMAEQKRLKERQLQEQLAREKERLEIRSLLKPQGR
jgi:hypothetical protein